MTDCEAPQMTKEHNKILIKVVHMTIFQVFLKFYVCMSNRTTFKLNLFLHRSSQICDIKNIMWLQEKQERVSH